MDPLYLILLIPGALTQSYPRNLANHLFSPFELELASFSLVPETH